MILERREMTVMELRSARKRARMKTTQFLLIDIELFDDFEVLNVDEDYYEGDDMPGVTEVRVPDFENVGVLIQQDSH